MEICGTQSDGTLLGIKGRYDLKDVAENERVEPV